MTPPIEIEYDRTTLSTSSDRKSIKNIHFGTSKGNKDLNTTIDIYETANGGAADFKIRDNNKVKKIHIDLPTGLEDSSQEYFGKPITVRSK